MANENTDEQKVNKQGIKEVKDLRVNIDACIQQTETTEGFGRSRALAIAKTKLEEAKMWAGVALGEHGSELPKEYQDKAS